MIAIPERTYATFARAKDVRAAAVRSGVDEAALTRGLSVRASGVMMILECVWGGGVSRGVEGKGVPQGRGEEVGISVIERKRVRGGGTKGSRAASSRTSQANARLS
mgnify:CR=1 FL=1